MSQPRDHGASVSQSQKGGLMAAHIQQKLLILLAAALCMAFWAGLLWLMGSLP